MSSKILHPLAIRLQELYCEDNEAQRTKTRFLNILEWDYRPEEMSDTENRIVWTGIVLLSLKCGLMVSDYTQQLGATAVQVQQWMNGVSMPDRTQMRKDLHRAIGKLVSSKQSSG